MKRYGLVAPEEGGVTPNWPEMSAKLFGLCELNPLKSHPLAGILPNEQAALDGDDRVWAGNGGYGNVAGLVCGPPHVKYVDFGYIIGADFRKNNRVMSD